MASTKRQPLKRTLSREKIVSAAMELADRDGIDALSMRQLATTLGVTAMSLYNHVSNRDELLDHMVERVAEKITTPTIGSDWESELWTRAQSLRTVLLQHRWALTIMISRIALGNSVNRDANATVGCLVECGFDYRQADWARNAIDSHVYGYVVQELNFPVEPDEYRAAAKQYLPMIDRQSYPYIHAASAEVADGTYDGMTDFDFGLGLVISGLKRWLADMSHR